MFILYSTLIYIDPGSGSYLVQVIIAAVLGIAFYFKNFWRWVKTFFTHKKGFPKNDN